MTLWPTLGAAQTRGKPETVSVSPYARQATAKPVTAHNAPTPSHYGIPSATQTSTPISRATTIKTEIKAPTTPTVARWVMPATPALSASSLTPSSVPKPPVAAVTTQIPAATDIPKKLSRPLQDMSITDVIDSTIKNAPDLPQEASTVASPPPAPEQIKKPVADQPPLLSVTPPDNAITDAAPTTGKAHQPSKQAIAQLGDAAPHFYWPLRGNVVSNFGEKGSGRKNDGINISAPKGTAIRSAANGLVVYSGQDLGGLGNLILVRHSGGFHTAYAHVDNVLVKTGDKVSAGEAIANVGKSGNVTTPQLHFEIRDGKKPVDPQGYLPRA